LESNMITSSNYGNRLRLVPQTLLLVITYFLLLFRKNTINTLEI